jgi:hypothetical protein
MLTRLQTDLLDALRLAVETKQCHQFAYCTEFLGYLPFGFYHWVEVDGQDISGTFPTEWCLDWGRQDLEALERVGLLRRMNEWQHPSDELETQTTYEVTSR